MGGGADTGGSRSLRGGTFALMLAAIIGVLGGIGGYTFLYAEGGSYLGNDPESCANCHVMQGHLDAWTRSTHHAVATCNDCHAPHGNILSKYYVKGVNGFNHSVAFTTGRFDEPIRITEMNRAVTEAACRYCHESTVHAIDARPRPGEAMSCIRCHSGVGHMN